MALTRSQIQACTSTHLEDADARWTAAAQLLEQQFEALHQGMLRPGGTAWEGIAADAAQERAFGDLVKARGGAGHLYAAAAAARHGAGELSWAQRQALDAIAEAEADGYLVGEDLSVRDKGWSTPERIGAAQSHAADIAAREATLRAVDTEVAGKVSTAIAPLGDIHFDDAPKTHGADKTVQTVDYRTAPFPQNPGPADPDDPNRHADYPNRNPMGQYGAGNADDGKAAEEAALKERERRTGIPIIRQQVRATHPDMVDPATGKAQGRLYDGLEPTGNPDEYIGIEAKTNPGALRADQQRFDNAVTHDRPATATLNGRPIKIVETVVAYPPDGWQPPTEEATPGSAVTGAAPVAPTAPGHTGTGVSEPGGGGGGGSWGDNPPKSSTFPNWGTYVSPEELAKSDDPALRILGQILLAEQQRKSGYGTA